MIRLDMYLFALKVGLSSLLKGNFLIGLKQILYPIGYWRCPVYPVVIHALNDREQCKILDIGSPKLLSLYLSLKYGHELIATDLQDRKIFDRYQKHFDDFLFTREKGRYFVEFQDASALP